MHIIKNKKKTPLKGDPLKKKNSSEEKPLKSLTKTANGKKQCEKKKCKNSITKIINP